MDNGNEYCGHTKETFESMEESLNALLADLQTNLNKVSPQPVSPYHHSTQQTTTITTTHQPTTIITTHQPTPTPDQHIYHNEDYRRTHSTQNENIHNGFHHDARPSGRDTSATSNLHTYQNLPPKDQMYRHEMREEVRTETRSSSSGPNPTPQRSAISNNLSELDSLLQDLNTTKQNSFHKETTVVNGSRPSVDSLLDELNSVGQRETIEKRSVHQETRTAQTPTPPPPPPPAPLSHHHKVSQASASNATKELDDLMESLSDFKNQEKLRSPALVRKLINASSLQTQVDTAYAKPLPKRRSPSPPPPPLPRPQQELYLQSQTLSHSQSQPASHLQSQPQPQPQPQSQSQPQPQPASKASPQNQLDSMLGSLTSHMTEQGINTSQKGCCCACDKPIVGQVITALGKTWHPEHFTCSHCKEELGTKNFFERDGKPYCEPDYHNLFSPKCAYCSGPILDKCVTAMNKTWHPEHFFCAQCGNTFGEEGFHEKNGKPYCKEDYFNMFAPKCGGCNNPIMENYISALNGQWHPECFVCRDCNQPFNGGSFFDHEGHPYCETHYHAKRGSLCAACNKPITGRCITAMFRKYHPEHFLCAFCLQQLNKGTFKEQNNKPYCHICFDKLYG